MIKKILLLTLVLGILSFPAIGSAAPLGPRMELGKKLNFLVHEGNKNRIVTRGKALETLMAYFGQKKSIAKKMTVAYNGDVRPLFADVANTHPLFGSIQTACSGNIFDCNGESFRPYRPISQKDLITWFYRLKEGEGSGSPLEYKEAWSAARELNLLPGGSQVTYDFLSEVLYRDYVTQNNYGQPYFEGLVADVSDIKVANYHQPEQINAILKSLHNRIFVLQKLDRRSSAEDLFLKKLQSHQERFRQLKDELRSRSYLLDSGEYPENIAQAIQDNHAQDILSEYRYDYSNDAAYRQHNIRTGLSKFNGLVMLPGEEVNYWKIISDKKLRDFRYGWVILRGGEESWEFGGGICGSASAIFNPVWLAGLDILERKPHSVFYKSLYNIANIGLDSTVYLPRPNLRFKNNFQDPVIFYVHDDTEQKVITVQVLGNSPYQNVEIVGPTYISARQIEWTRKMEYFDGTRVEETLSSRYNAIK